MKPQLTQSVPGGAQQAAGAAETLAGWRGECLTDAPESTPGSAPSKGI